MKILRRLSSDQVKRVKMMSLTLLAGVCFTSLTKGVVYAQSGEIASSSTLVDSQFAIGGKDPSQLSLIGANGEQELTGTEKSCESWLFLGGSSLLSDSALGIALALLLMYVFLGIAVVTDIFMEAITKITSRTETVQVKDLRGKTMELSVPIWNPRVANVTLLALGAAAPEIFLCFFSTFADIESAPKDIGPMALIGSASFNMLVVTGTSIMAVAQVKRVLSLSTFIVTAAFASFAYLWLFLVLVVFSPAYIEFWEAMTTLIFYPLFLFFVWATQKCASENQSESEELDANKRMVCKQTLMNLAKSNGKMYVLDIITGQPTSAPAAEVEYVNEYFKICLGVENLAETSIDELLEVLEPENPIDRLMLRKGLKAIRTQSLTKVTTSDLVGKSGQKQKRNNILGFQHMAYAVAESAGTITLKVVKRVSEEHSFVIRTIDGSAKSLTQFDEINMKVTMRAHENEREIFVKINESSNFQPNSKFQIVLLDNQDHAQMDGIDSCATVTILDNDSSGSFGFKNSILRASKNDKKISVVVRRIEGSTGCADIRLNAQLKNYEDFGANIKFEAIKNQLIAFEDNQEEAQVDIALPQNMSSDISSLVVEASLSAPTQAELSEQSKCIIEIRSNSDDNKIEETRQNIQEVIARNSDLTWGSQFKNACSRPQGESKIEKFVDLVSVPWKLLFATIPPRDYMGGWAAFVLAFAAIGLVTLLVMEITLTLGCLFNLRSGIQALVLLAVGLSMPNLTLSRSVAKKAKHADASVGLASSASAASIFVGLGLPWTIATVYHWMKYDEAFYVGKFETADMAFSLAILGACTLISLVILALRRRISGGEIGGPSRYFSGTILILLWVVFVATSNLNSYGYFGRRDMFVPEAQIKATTATCATQVRLNAPTLTPSADGNGINVNWNLSSSPMIPNQAMNCQMSWESSLNDVINLDGVCDCKTQSQCFLSYGELENNYGFYACEEIKMKMQLYTNGCTENWSDFSAAVPVKSNLYFKPVLALSSLANQITWTIPNLDCLRDFRGVTVDNTSVLLERQTSGLPLSQWTQVMDLAIDPNINTFSITSADEGFIYRIKAVPQNVADTYYSYPLQVGAVSTVASLAQMERVVVDDLNEQCAVLLKWREPPSLSSGEQINMYNIYIKKRDTGPGGVQFGQDFNGISRECGLTPKLGVGDIIDGEYQWCIVSMQKLTQSPFFLGNGDELIATVSATDQSGGLYQLSEDSIPSYVWGQTPFTGNLLSQVIRTAPTIDYANGNQNQGYVKWSGLNAQITPGQYTILWYQPRGAITDQWQAYGDDTNYLTYSSNGQGMFFTMPQPLDQYEYQIRTKNTCGYSASQYYSLIGYTSTGLVRNLGMTPTPLTCDLVIQWDAPQNTGSYNYEIEIITSNRFASSTGQGLSITNTASCAYTRKCILTLNTLQSYGFSNFADLSVQVKAVDNVSGSQSQWNRITENRLNVGSAPTKPQPPVISGNTASWIIDPVAQEYTVRDTCGRTVCVSTALSGQNSCFSALLTDNTCQNARYQIQTKNGCGETWSDYSTAVVVLTRPIISVINASAVSCSINIFIGFQSSSQPIGTRFTVTDTNSGQTFPLSCATPFTPSGVTNQYFSQCTVQYTELNGLGIASGSFSTVSINGYASNASGESDIRTSNPVTISSVAPNAPQNVNITERTSTSSTSAFLSWGPVAGAIGYQISYSVDRFNPQIMDVTATNANIQNLSPGVTYFFQIYSKGQCGISAIPKEIQSVVTQVNVLPVLGQPSVYATCQYVQVSQFIPNEITTSSSSNYNYITSVRNNLNQFVQVNACIMNKYPPTSSTFASCLFDTSILTQAPYNLQSNMQIQLQVTARDVTGNQPQAVLSAINSLATIQSCQVAPNDYTVTTSTQCNDAILSWNQPNFSDTQGYTYQIKVQRGQGANVFGTSGPVDVTSVCQSNSVAFSSGTCTLNDNYLRQTVGLSNGELVIATMVACDGSLCSNEQSTLTTGTYNAYVGTSTFNTFQLSQPVHNHMTSTYTFTWTQAVVSGRQASSYQLQSSTSDGFSSNWINVGSPVQQTSVSVPAQSISGLNSSTSLSFKVVATDNQCNVNGDSMLMNFNPPRAPVVFGSMNKISCNTILVNYGANASSNSGMGSTINYFVSVKGRNNSNLSGGINNVRDDWIQYNECNLNNLVDPNSCNINTDTLRSSRYNLYDNDLIEIQVSAYDQTWGNQFTGIALISAQQNGEPIRLPTRKADNFPGPQITEVQTVTGSFDYVLVWQPEAGYTQALYEDKDNRGWILVPLTPGNEYRYTIPTLGEVSIIRFKLIATSLDGCDVAESMRVQYTYEQKPGQILSFTMTESESCTVKFDWSAALSTGTGNVFRYVVEIKDKNVNGTNQWRAYPGCGFDGSTSCLVPMSTFQAFYGYQIGDPIEAKIYAQNTAGDGPHKIVDNNISMNTAPSGVDTPTVLNPQSSPLVINWGAISTDNSISYQLFWDQGNSLLQLQQFIPLSTQGQVTSFTVDNQAAQASALQSSTIRFIVQTSNSCGIGSYSPILSVYRAREPGMVALEITQDGCEVKFTWQTPTDNGGSDVTNYELSIQRNDFLNSQFSNVSTTMRRYDQCNRLQADVDAFNRFTCKVTMSDLLEDYNLAVGDFIIAQVIAVNQVGAGYPTPIQSNFPLISRPAKVQQPEILNLQGNQIAIRWNPLFFGSNNNFLGANTFQYAVRYDSSNGITENWIQADALPINSQNFFQVVAANGDITYKFQVMASNECGNGQWSDTLTVNIAQAPGIIQINSVQMGCSIQFQWQRPENNGAEIVGYKLEVQTQNTLSGTRGWAVVPNCGTFVQQQLGAVLDTVTCTVPMSTFINSPFFLSEGDMIVVQGAAQNTKGWGQYPQVPHTSNVALTSTPGQMGDMRALPQPSTTNPSITLSWDPIQTQFMNTNINDLLIYELYWDQGGQLSQNGQVQWTLLNTTPSTQYIVNSDVLSQFSVREFSFKVAARNSCGTGAFSRILPLRLTEVPDQMNIFTSVDSCNLRVYWTVPNDGGDPINNYSLSVQQLNGQLVNLGQLCLTSPQSCTNNSCSCSIPMQQLKNYPYLLQDGQPVIVQGYATNSNGNGVISTPNSYGVTMQSIPAIMQPPRLVSKTESRITLAWTQIFGQNSQGNGAFVYELLWDEGSGLDEFVVFEEFPNPTATINLTIIKQAYQFKIRARNPCGTSVPSQILPVQLATVPSQMIPINTETVGCSVRISWYAPRTGGAAIEQYNIEVMSAGNTYLPLQACSGAQNLQSNTCTVPMAVLEVAPYYLTHNTLIRVRGKAFNNNGWAVLWSDPNTTGSTIIASAPVMNQPFATSESPTSITVAWSNPSTVNFQTGSTVNSLPPNSKYELMFDGGQNMWSSAYVGLGTQTSVPINSSIGRNFRFKVRAHSDCGWGDYSPDLVVTIETCPGEVTVLTSIEGCSVRIQWQTPYNGGLPITNYQIEIATDPSSQSGWQQSQHCGTQSGFGNNGNNFNVNNGNNFQSFYQNSCMISMDNLRQAPYYLSSGQQIMVRAKAYNSIGWGQASISSSSTQVLSTPPNFVLPPTLEFKTLNLITFSWDSVYETGQLQNENDMFEVFWATDSTSGQINQQNWQQIDTIRDTRFTFNIPNGGANAYAFKVRSSNQCGYGSYSPPLRVTLASVPMQMLPVTTTVQGCSILVTWTEPQNGGSPIINYSLRLCNGRNSNGTCVSIDQICTQNSFNANQSCLIPMSALSISPFRLASGDKVIIEVAAQNGVGIGEWSPRNDLNAVPMTSQPPQMSVPRLVHKTSGTMIISWDAVTGLQNGQFSYELWWDQGSRNQFVQLTETDRLTYTVLNINSSLSYRYKVRARTACGYGMFSNELGITFYDVPDQMQPVTVTNDMCSARLSWVHPNDGGSNILRYRLFIQASNSYQFVELDSLCETDPDVTGQPVPNTCVIPMSSLMTGNINLREGEQIIVRISAQNAAGWGMQSAANYAGATIESGAPAMGEVRVAQAEQNYQLSWSHPQNNAQQFSSSFAGYTYEVEFDNGTGSQQFVVIGSTPNNSYIVTNINPSLTYTFRVRAKNTCGYGSYSNPTVGQGVVPPSRLARPTVSLVGCNVIFSWGEVSNDGGNPVTTNQIAVADNQGFYQTVTACVTGAGQSYCSVPYQTFTSAPFSLQIGTTIKARAAACNAFNCGAPSAVGQSLFTIQNINKPTAPRRVTTGAIVDNLSAKEILLEWDTHFGAENYDVYYRQQGEPDFKILLANTAVNSYTVYGLSGDYEFYIKANNYCGISTPSLNSNIAEYAIEVAPQAVSQFLTDKNGDSCTIQFTWVDIQENLEFVSGYQIQVKAPWNDWKDETEPSEILRKKWINVDMTKCSEYSASPTRAILYNSCTVNASTFWELYMDRNGVVSSGQQLFARIAAKNQNMEGAWSDSNPNLNQLAIGTNGQPRRQEIGYLATKCLQTNNVKYTRYADDILISWDRFVFSAPATDDHFRKYEFQIEGVSGGAQLASSDINVSELRYPKWAGYNELQPYRIQVRGETTCGYGEWSTYAIDQPNIMPQQMSKVIAECRDNDIQFTFDKPGQSVTEYFFEVQDKQGDWIEVSDTDCPVSLTNLSPSCTISKNELSNDYDVNTNAPLVSRVRAKNEQGDQDVWSPVCQNPFKMEQPIISDYSPTSMTVSWDALEASLTGTNAITGYEIHFGQESQAFTSLIFTAIDTSNIFTGLSTGIRYQYKVRAISSCGNGCFSELITDTTKTCPGVMAEPTVDLNASNEIEVSWVDPISSGDGIIDEYLIKFVNYNGELVEIDECDGKDSNVITNKSCTLSMVQVQNILLLEQGDRIQASVQARNGYCYSDRSPITSIGQEVYGCPARMDLDPITRAEVTETTVVISWNPVVPGAGSDPIEIYEVQYRRSDGEWDPITLRSTGIVEYEFTNLENTVSYDFRVRARNSFCEGPWSLKQSVATGKVPNTPSEVKTELVNMLGNSFTTSPYTCSDDEDFEVSEQIKLSWAMGVDGDSGINRYTIYFEVTNSIGETEEIEYPLVCDGSLSEVITSKSCTFPMSTFWSGPLQRSLGLPIIAQVKATNIHGDSSISPKNIGEVNVQQKPKKIETMQAVKSTNTPDVTLSWQRLDTNYQNGNSEILSYAIDWFVLADGAVRLAEDDILWNNLDGYPCPDWLPLAASTKTEMIHAGIPSDTNIHYTIRAKNVWGWGPYSEEFIVSSPRKSDAPVLSLIDPTVIVIDPSSSSRMGLIQVNWEKSVIRGATRVFSYEVEFKTGTDTTGTDIWEKTDLCAMDSRTIFQHRTQPQLLYCKVSMQTFWDWGMEFDDLAIVRVRSENVAGLSEWSTSNTYGASIENTPAQMRAVKRDPENIVSTVIPIVWDMPTTAAELRGTQTISKFILQYSTTETGPWTAPPADGTFMSATGETTETFYDYKIPNSADPDADYCFRIKAENVYGPADEYSEPECFKQILIDLPPKMNMADTSNPAGSVPERFETIIIKWEKPTVTPAVESYSIKIKSGALSVAPNTWQVADELCEGQLTAASTSCEFDAEILLNDYGYFAEDQSFSVQIQAINSAGPSEWSDASESCLDPTQAKGDTCAQVSSEQVAVLKANNLSGALRLDNRSSSGNAP